MESSTTPVKTSSFQQRSARPMLVVVVTVVAGWGLLVAFMLHGDRKPSPPQSPAIGRKLEQLQLQPLLGDAQPLSAKDLTGKVVLMNFWGTWCMYCRVEMPELVEIHERYKDNPEFQFVSISCDADVAEEQEQKLREETESYLQSKGYDFAVHRDQGGASRRAVVELAEMRDGFSFPMTLIFDRTGAVRGLYPGYADGTATLMNDLIDELMSKKE